MINPSHFCNAIAWHVKYLRFSPLQQQCLGTMASSSTTRISRFLMSAIQPCTPRQIYLQDSLLGSVDINCHERRLKICWCSFWLTQSTAIKPRLSPTAQQQLSTAMSGARNILRSCVKGPYLTVSRAQPSPRSQWVEKEHELWAHKQQQLLIAASELLPANRCFPVWQCQNVTVHQ